MWFNPILANLIIPNLSYSSIRKMARTKQAARKSSGPKGVPRHRLARQHDDEASGGRPPKPQTEMESLQDQLTETSRERALGVCRIACLENKIKKMTAEAAEREAILEQDAQTIGGDLKQAYRNQHLDKIRIKDLEKQVKQLVTGNENAERRMAKLVGERNTAWQREDVARERVHELEFYVEDIEEHNTILHEEVYRLRYPNAGAAEGEDGIISEGEVDGPEEEGSGVNYAHAEDMEDSDEDEEE